MYENERLELLSYCRYLVNVVHNALNTQEQEHKISRFPI